MNGQTVKIMSFGFKHGMVEETNLLFDVRFLPNPFYIENLKKKTGIETEIIEYIMSFEQSKEYLKKVCELSLFTVEQFFKKDRKELTISFGCTGGQHRSVALAHLLSGFLKEQGYHVVSFHRDLEKYMQKTIS